MPAPSNRPLSALRVSSPAAWRRKVRAALVAAESIPTAASALGVGSRTLERWIEVDPALRDGVNLPAPRGITARTNPAGNKGVPEIDMKS